MCWEGHKEVGEPEQEPEQKLVKEVNLLVT